MCLLTLGVPPIYTSLYLTYQIVFIMPLAFIFPMYELMVVSPVIALYDQILTCHVVGVSGNEQLQYMMYFPLCTEVQGSQTTFFLHRPRLSIKFREMQDHRFYTLCYRRLRGAACVTGSCHVYSTKLVFKGHNCTVICSLHVFHGQGSYHNILYKFRV